MIGPVGRPGANPPCGGTGGGVIAVAVRRGGRTAAPEDRAARASPRGTSLGQGRWRCRRGRRCDGTGRGPAARRAVSAAACCTAASGGGEDQGAKLRSLMTGASACGVLAGGLSRLIWGLRDARQDRPACGEEFRHVHPQSRRAVPARFRRGDRRQPDARHRRRRARRATSCAPASRAASCRSIPHHDDDRRASRSIPTWRIFPRRPDLAVIATPPETVPGLLGELGARGTRAAVVITAGFAELGERGPSAAAGGARGGAAPSPAHRRAQLRRRDGAGDRARCELLPYRAAGGRSRLRQPVGRADHRRARLGRAARHRLFARRLAGRHGGRRFRRHARLSRRRSRQRARFCSMSKASRMRANSCRRRARRRAPSRCSR